MSHALVGSSANCFTPPRLDKLSHDWVIRAWYEYQDLTGISAPLNTGQLRLHGPRFVQ